MATDDERRAAARRLARIDDAFRRGDLEALRNALDDRAFPNGIMPMAIGPCITYAIYHSPLFFIRALLSIGANPDGPADDGFTPLIAALMAGRGTPGATKRVDVDDIVRILLAAGADPNRRGINDGTPLHVAVESGNALAVQRLLDAGADPDARTALDDHETPLELARRLGHATEAAILERKGQLLHERLRRGLTLLLDIPGDGEPVRRQHRYRIRLRLWIGGAEPVRWKDPGGPVGVASVEDDGATLLTDVRIDRRSLVNGLFYGVEGMRVGGTRRLEIAPHLAYGGRGLAGLIPGQALLTAEISVLAACESSDALGA